MSGTTSIWAWSRPAYRAREIRCQYGSIGSALDEQCRLYLQVVELDGTVERDDGHFCAGRQARSTQMRAVGRLIAIAREEQFFEMLGDLADQPALDTRPADVDGKDVMQGRRRTRKRAGCVRVVLDPIVPIHDEVDRA